MAAVSETKRMNCLKKKDLIEHRHRDILRGSGGTVLYDTVEMNLIKILTHHHHALYSYS
jgi:hypothetical protein